MPAILERCTAHLGKLEVQFIHQAGGLEGVARRASLKVPKGDGSKIAVGKGYHLLKSFPIAFLPPMKKLGDLVRDRWIAWHECSILRKIGRGHVWTPDT